MLLDAGERLVLLSLLPVEGDLTAIRIVHELKQALSFTEEEHKSLNFRTDEEGFTTWDSGVNSVKDIPIGRKAHEQVQNALDGLNAEKKLTENHLSLWDKFSEEVNVVEIDNARTG